MNSPTLSAAQIHALAVLPLARRAQVLALVSIGVSFPYALALARSGDNMGLRFNSLPINH